MWSIHLVGCYAAVARSRALPHPTRGTHLENIMLSGNSRCRGAHIVGFHSLECPEQANPHGQKGDQGSLGAGDVLLMGMGVLPGAPRIFWN